jgi:hypothetical protein
MDATFYDAGGNPTAYTEDNIYIYLFSGEPVAYIMSRTSVYSFGGTHLGRFENGWIRDNDGLCVLFTQNASGGPTKPTKGMKPMKRLKHLRPSKGARETGPVRLVKSSSWSDLSGDKFFEQ